MFALIYNYLIKGSKYVFVVNFTILLKRVMFVDNIKDLLRFLNISNYIHLVIL